MAFLSRCANIAATLLAPASALFIPPLVGGRTGHHHGHDYFSGATADSSAGDPLVAYADRQEGNLQQAISAAMQSTAGHKGGAASDEAAAGQLHALDLSYDQPSNISDREKDQISSESEQMWIFAAYHKTGCELAVGIMATMREHGNKAQSIWDVNMVGDALRLEQKQIFWPGKWDNFYFEPKMAVVGLLQNFRMVHWIRDPAAIVLSAYRFHASCPPGEPWLSEPMSKIDKIDILRYLIHKNRPDLHKRLHKAIARDESLCKFYQEGGLPEEDGVIIEAYRSQHEIKLMNTNLMKTAKDERVLQVPMEAVLADFTGTMACVFEFLGHQTDDRGVDKEAAMRKVKHLDLSRGRIAEELTGHVTQGKYDNAAIQALVEQVPHVMKARKSMMKHAPRSNICGAEYLYN